jgi:hypothetical protein
MKVLVKIPTKNRGADWLKNWVDNIADVENTTIVLTLDSDAKDLEDIKDTIWKINNHFSKLVLFDIGESKGKIHACNRDIEKYIDDFYEFDIFVLGSDDMIPQHFGFDDILRKEFEALGLDSALCYWDGAKETKNKLCTYPILGRTYLRRFGYIYNPEYDSLFADNEFTEVGKKLGKLHFRDTIMFRHKHHAWGTRAKDALDTHNDTFWNKDKKTYQRRKKSGFDLHLQKKEIETTPEPEKTNLPKWAILIPTIVGREVLLNRVGTNLRKQIESLELSGIVEILTNCDNKQKSIGKKRNELVLDAHQKGYNYISFIDDDDNVSLDYVYEIYEKIKAGFDCITIDGLYTSRSERTEWVMKAGIKNQNKDGKYYRQANHLACWDINLPLSVKFKEISLGEDSDFANRVQSKIQNPAHIEKILYFYEFNSANSVQTKIRPKISTQKQQIREIRIQENLEKRNRNKR